MLSVRLKIAQETVCDLWSWLMSKEPEIMIEREEEEEEEGEKGKRDRETAAV